MAEFSLLCLNAAGDNLLGGKGIQDFRKTVLAEVISRSSADVVAVQESPWGGAACTLLQHLKSGLYRDSEVCRVLNTYTTFYQPGKSSSSVILVKRSKFTDMERIDLASILEQQQGAPSHLSRLAKGLQEILNSFDTAPCEEAVLVKNKAKELLHRMCCVRLSTTAGARKVVVVSVHGQYKNLGGGRQGVAARVRVALFRFFARAMHLISAVYEAPILFGGDLNMDAGKRAKVIGGAQRTPALSQLQVVDVPLLQPGKARGTIDYVGCSVVEEYSQLKPTWTSVEWVPWPPTAASAKAAWHPDTVARLTELDGGSKLTSVLASNRKKPRKSRSVKGFWEEYGLLREHLLDHVPLLARLTLPVAGGVAFVQWW